MSLEHLKISEELEAIAASSQWLTRRRMDLRKKLADLASREVKRGDVFASKKRPEFFVADSVERSNSTNEGFQYIDGIIVPAFYPYEMQLSQQRRNVEYTNLLNEYTKCDWRIEEDGFEVLKKTEQVLAAAEVDYRHEMRGLLGKYPKFRAST